jgi:hypothetical protein
MATTFLFLFAPVRLRVINMSDQTHAEEQRRKDGRLILVFYTIIAVAGLLLGWNKGQLPRRDEPAAAAGSAAGATAPDLVLYHEMIAAVRGGANYYDAAREAIPRHGFPIASPLNWRLPTYAWLLSRLPNNGWIQAVLLLLAIGGLGVAFAAVRRRAGAGYAGLTALLLFGVARWTFDGEAYLAQEVWAAQFLVFALAAHSLGQSSKPWRALAVVTGLLALFFRELALPFCGIACLLAAWNRRWVEAAAWAAGIAAFMAFFAWHISQVRAQLAGTEVAAAAGLSQWLRYGGQDFVLLTTRMNSLLFAAPGWMLWLYVLASLVGLARRPDETNQLACLTALAYVLIFAFAGRPENFYWGLMPAPLLAWGAAQAVPATKELLASVQHLPTHGATSPNVPAAHR